MTNNNLDNYVPENIRDVFVSKASASQNDNNLAGENESSCKAEEKKNEGETVMDNKPENAEAVKAELEASFAEKEAKFNETIASLEGEKSDLTAKNEELTVANESLTKQIEELNASKAELEQKVSDLTSEKESAVAECESAKRELAKIKKEQLTASRKNELATAGLLISDETLQEKQIAKISEMSDEQFADYVSELGAIASAKEEKKPEVSASKEENESEGKEESNSSCKASVSVKSPVTDAEIYTSTIASIQAPSVNEEGVSKYAQM